MSEAPLIAFLRTTIFFLGSCPWQTYRRRSWRRRYRFTGRAVEFWLGKNTRRELWRYCVRERCPPKCACGRPESVGSKWYISTLTDLNSGFLLHFAPILNNRGCFVGKIKISVSGIINIDASSAMSRKTFQLAICITPNMNFPISASPPEVWCLTPDQRSHDFLPTAASRFICVAFIVKK